jgi:hypothetical protein
MPTPPPAGRGRAHVFRCVPLPMSPGWTRILKWCPGAESNHRLCDFQSHALPTELPGHFQPKGPGAAVYSQAARPCPPCPASARTSPQEAPRRLPRHLPRRAKTRSKSLKHCRNGRVSFVGRLHPRRHYPQSRRNPTASGSGRPPGSVPNRKAARQRWTACRRSGTAWRRLCRQVYRLAAQLAFNQPKRIGNPSPPSRVTVS